ncbi:hypothetical protein [Actinomadura opuntiae]|uniref:hypothetical protein n=1 Tax=Actinomadura sp. OS1-43 TaxID=604315 RepID=UPI00255AC79F|nr:hypothetical protein [Actinomadura sp. OS1-43]MDL4817491.1 hypothetical protein [Actinomadura sp. OS1-43]
MTRRGRRRAGVLAAAAVLASLGAVPASADVPFPNYTCDRTFPGHKGKGWGYQHCEAAAGAPERGRVDGPFLIGSRAAADPTFWCRTSTEENFPAGEAELPDRVLGFRCERLAS